MTTRTTRKTPARRAKVSRDTTILGATLEHLERFGGKVHAFGDHNGNSKHPLSKGGFATATDDPAAVERKLANPAATGAAWYPPSDILVIDCDVDPDKGKDGLAALEDLAAEHGGNLPKKTAAVASPRGNGSQHKYYRLPEGVRVPSTNGALGDGLDVRSGDGRYWIAAPGSTTPKGMYEWIVPPGKIADAPQWLIDAAIEAGQRKSGERVEGNHDPANWIIEPDLPHNVERFEKWCSEDARPAIEGQQGDSNTAAVGAKAFSLGLTVGSAFEVAWDHFNPRCEPPWDDDEFEVKITSGWNSATHHFGDQTNEFRVRDMQALFIQAKDARDKSKAAKDGGQPEEVITREEALEQALELPAPLPPTSALDVRDFSEVLLDETPRPVEELIPGWVEKHIPNFLSGPGGVHKSRLALQMGLCIHAGTSVLGLDTQQSTFVQVSCEDPADEITRRTHAMAKRLQLSADMLHGAKTLDRYGKPSAIAIISEGGEYELTAFHKELRDFLKAIDGHKFVVCDSAYDLARFRGNAKIDEDAVNVYIKQVLVQFCIDTNSTLLLPWHPSYSGQERGDGSGWSVAWHNAPRNRSTLKAAKGGLFELGAAKRNHGKLPDPMLLYYSQGALMVQTDLDRSEIDGAAIDALFEMVKRDRAKGLPVQKFHGSGVKIPDMVAELVQAGHAVSKADVEKYLLQLVRDGNLKWSDSTSGKNASPATYDLTEKG